MNHWLPRLSGQFSNQEKAGFAMRMVGVAIGLLLRFVFHWHYGLFVGVLMIAAGYVITWPSMIKHQQAEKKQLEDLKDQKEN